MAVLLCCKNDPKGKSTLHDPCCPFDRLAATRCLYCNFYFVPILDHTGKETGNFRCYRCNYTAPRLYLIDQRRKKKKNRSYKPFTQH